jgi:DNA-binding GntR family transcriptional regulator
LKEAIFAGQFLPGEMLRELQVARMLSVSQATVREALVKLEQVGLVVRERNRRTSVTCFTPEEVRHRLAVRLVLEEMAFAEACTRLADEDLAGLAELARHIERALEERANMEMSAADMRFHSLVWERSGNPVLAHTLNQLTTPLFAFLGLTLHARPDGSRHPMPHQSLVDALATRNPEEVRRAVRAHIEGSYASLLPAPAE